MQPDIKQWVGWRVEVCVECKKSSQGSSLTDIRGLETCRQEYKWHLNLNVTSSRFVTNSDQGC